MEGTYTERILTIEDRNRVAALITFGARLQSHLPHEWFEEFPSKSAFIAWWQDRRDNPPHLQKQELQPKVIVNFNLVPESMDAKGISDAYDNPKAEDAFRAMIKETVEDGAIAQKIMAMHSQALVSTVHEAMDAREWLIKRMAEHPDDAKWIRVLGSKKGSYALFGKLATRERISEELNKIG